MELGRSVVSTGDYHSSYRCLHLKFHKSYQIYISFPSGALCFAELGTIIPKSGAQYAYLQAAFGDAAAYIFAWTANIVLKPSSLAIIMLACAEYALQPFYEGAECGPPPMVVKLVAGCGICKYKMVTD